MKTVTPAERPVFDAANSNSIKTDFAVPTSIPTGKEAARAELAQLMLDSPAITYCSYKPPRGPSKRKARKYTAANDNVEPLPVIEALRRDGRHDDILWVSRYRLLVDVVGASPFDDEIEMSDEGMDLETRSLHLSGKAFTKSFATMTSTCLPGGEVSYREPRHTVKQRVSIGQRTNAADDDGGQTQTPLRLTKSEDERITRIDGRPILAALRIGIGDLIVPFEEAVLGGATLTEIGDEQGFKWKARSANAKVAVYTAIDRLRDQWRLIERQMVAEATVCERRVDARREELEAERVRYLGLAA